MSIHSYIQKARRIQRDIRVDTTLQNHLLWLLLLRTVLYTLLLIASYFLEDSQHNLISTQASLIVIIVVAVYATSLFSAFYLLIFQGNLYKFGFNQILLDTLFASLLIFFSGTSLSHFTVVYFFPIITAGLLFPIKGGLFTAATVSLQLGLLLFFEQQNITLPYLKEQGELYTISLNDSLKLFTTHGLLFFLTALLSFFFGQRLLKTEAALSDSLQKYNALSLLYKKIFDNISTGLITLDRQNRISSANTAFENIVGINSEETIGREIHTLFPDLQLQKENCRYSIDFQRPTGEWLRIGYSHILMAPEQKKEEGSTTEILISMRDITELENLEQQVRQAEKLAAIGTMSASIAHDFRNPLTAILGSSQILAADFNEAEEQNSTHLTLTDIIQRESNRLLKTISDFLKFARPEKLQFQWIPLSISLEEVIEMLKAGNNLPATAQITTNFVEELAVWSDEKQLFTLLTHLIQNSLPFCPAGQEQIKITACEITNNISNDETSSWIEITVADNGRGIQETPLELIFEPFHTSRADGTGLGLAIVQQIIKDNHGTITVSNLGLPNKEGGQGACFTIHLPLLE